MKIKLLVLIVVAAFVLGGCASVLGPSSKAETYQYVEQPEVCFFPKAQAKWDGYKLTNKNWNKLTDYLKLMFIFEGIKELERTKKVTIKIKDSNRTLMALNYGIDKINRDLPDTNISMISFFYDILQEAKMVTPRAR